MHIIDREELARAAGFFDGEGHVGVNRRKNSTGGQSVDLYLSISQTDRRVLDRFKSAVGAGRISGPFSRTRFNPNENDVYYFQTARFEHVQAIIVMLWTWLDVVKREQAVAALTAVKERPGHQKTCKHGHPRTPANTYWSKGQSHCKPCRLGQWSAHREKQRNLRVVQ